MKQVYDLAVAANRKWRLLPGSRAGHRCGKPDSLNSATVERRAARAPSSGVLRRIRSFRITLLTVVAGLVPATPEIRTQGRKDRGGRDKLRAPADHDH